MAESAVEVREVTKRFPNGVHALDTVDLTIERSQFISIVGASGCGKSTLLRIVAGLIPPSDGEVEVNGTAVVGPRQDVGVMFQRPTLLGWQSALENTLLPNRIRGRATGADERKARELLALLGLAGFENTYPAHLSGGMQQRVALARLLMIGADVLLLDEPFAAVDEITRERLNLELLSLHARTGATVILVTHNITEAVLLADRVYVMTPRPGRIARILDVPFERPRDPGITASAEFGRIAFEARKALELTDVPAVTR